METQVKILIAQIVFLVIWYLGMYPSTPLAKYMEKTFKDYNKALNTTIKVQVIGIIATLLIWLLIKLIK